jgi:hypothetical protein
MKMSARERVMRSLIALSLLFLFKLTCCYVIPRNGRSYHRQVEKESTVYYIYAPARSGKVLLLATWPSESVVAVQEHEEPRVRGTSEESSVPEYDL